MKKSEFGLIGLGVMGSNLALNILDKEIKLSVYNRDIGEEATVVHDFLDENNSYTNLYGFTTLKEFVDSIERPRRILIMIKAGTAMDYLLADLLPLLNDHDVLIDGGNSLYTDTEKRIKNLSEQAVHYIGCGISGGAEGARNGPSLMPSGSKAAYKLVSPILEKLAAKDKYNRPCCSYIGLGGSGHYVKMIHNGIEYAEMQLLAEMYGLLSTNMDYQEIAALFQEWNNGELHSYLLEISIEILRSKENEIPILDIILDKSGNKGTGFWSVRSGLELGLPVTMMSSALFARYISSFKEKRLQYSSKILKSNNRISQIDIQQLKDAYTFARLINHHQGFEILKEASNCNNWELDLSEIARLWTNGCILRSNLMEDLVKTFNTSESLLESDSKFKKLDNFEKNITHILQHALMRRNVMDCFYSAYNYWISITSEKLPANFIQAQRDYFGGHGFNRLDDESDDLSHYNWYK